jgi:hypothetical protein
MESYLETIILPIISKLSSTLSTWHYPVIRYVQPRWFAISIS